MKPTFDEFISTCTPLLRIPELEEKMLQRVRSIVTELLFFQPNSDSTNNLKTFLKKDKDFLGVLLALTNLSQEKFLRILTAQRFANNDFDKEWGIKKIIKKLNEDDDFAEKIAKLFLEGKDSKLLANKIADFYLDQLSLPANWSEVIRDENLISNIVRKKLTGEYTDQKGEYVEKIIKETLEKIKFRFQIPYSHGRVPFLGKEIDYALPSLNNSIILIMVSYMETTSSGQTARAHEQEAMYQRIVGENIRYTPQKRIFINIIDGAGWLARRSDLHKMFTGCDYCLNMNTLTELENIIPSHISGTLQNG